MDHAAGSRTGIDGKRGMEKRAMAPIVALIARYALGAIFRRRYKLTTNGRQLQDGARAERHLSSFLFSDFPFPIRCQTGWVFF
jgi:hypothetical protein